MGRRYDHAHDAHNGLTRRRLVEAPFDFLQPAIHFFGGAREAIVGWLLFFLLRKEKKKEMVMKPGVIAIVLGLILVVGTIVGVVVAFSSSVPVAGAPSAAPAQQRSDPGNAPNNDSGNAAKMDIPTVRDLTGVDASSFTVGSFTDAMTSMLK